MAVPFSNTKLRVPKGFQNVLEGLAREVLRNQPENIYEFGAKYFEQMLSVRDETGHDPAVHGARLEDRFYNNDSFKSPVVDSGDPQQQDAALKIQTEFRRHAAVKEVETMQEEEAALTIQSSFRGHQDREKVKQMIVEKSSVSKEEEEEVDIDLDDPDVEKAAIKIQAGFKGFKARKEVKEEQEKSKEKKDESQNTDLDKAATKIQAGYRGYRVRKGDIIKPKEKREETKEEEIDIDLTDPEVEKAATKIQAGFRGHKTRQDMKGKTESEAKVDAPKQDEEEVDIDLNDPEVEKAATKIQAGFRGHKTRKEMQSKEQEEKVPDKVEETEEIDIDLNDPDVEKAAIKIQASFKGFQSRKEMKNKTEEEKVPDKVEETEEIDIDLNDPDVEKAAIKIQASFKGFQARKDMQTQKDESAPTEEKKEESAPTETKTEGTVQTEEKKEEKKEEEEVDIDLDDPNTENAALKIQAGFRGYKTRKELQGQTKDEKPTETDSKTETKEETKTDSKGDEVDIDLNDPEVEKAATKIQAGFKGYKTRKDMKDKPEDSSGEKTEEGEKKVEALRITLNPQQATTIIDVLSAFPSFKKPKDLPDHLRLSKIHIRRVKKWRKSAMENLKNPTFEKTNRLTIKAFKMFENEGMFEKDKKEEIKDKKEEKGEEHKSEESEDKEEEGQAHVFEDSSSDEDEEFDGFDFDTDNPEFQEKMTDMMGDVFGTLFGGNQKNSQADKTGTDKLMQSATNMIPMIGGMASKPLMYKPYKAMTEALEKWIDEHVSSLPSKELEARVKQLQIMKDICAKYEEQDLDDEGNYKVKQEANVELLEMMAKVESVGGKLPPEVTAKGETGFDVDNFHEAMPDIMYSLTDGLETMFKGLGSLGNPNKKQREDGDEVEEDVDSCTIL